MAAVSDHDPCVAVVVVIVVVGGGGGFVAFAPPARPAQTYKYGALEGKDLISC